ncbi:hypothetical protein N7468_003494 [Penicillium chermesinum]|uniref:Protein kinase domain-containing protein n=1 Tax=Penicillium chermesinum TaxID=63820 RepID=A0A9W9P754_9EURO|nr:uncharacterized protein N7468_003494 [Penicillium chermesinum]KAJ5238875.1 hypothetical protein N7468_003494 [Penicillium chermesinum]KAJ6164513.1 hypothetical protein N7470_003185 [Penicillium chermesinum]
MRPHDLHEKEKQIVSAIRAPLRAANPFLVTDRHNEKQLCVSSRNLSLSDFQLLKTLGTGTFARVWLARLKDSDDKTKVYALKILRKADGEPMRAFRNIQGSKS